MHQRETLLSVVAILFLFLLTNVVSAQNKQQPPLFDLDGIQLEIFSNADNYRGWDARQLMAHSINTDVEIGFPENGFSKQYSNRALSPMYRIHLTLTPLNRKSGQPEFTRELQIGASYYRNLQNSLAYTSAKAGVNDTIFTTKYIYSLKSDELSMDGSFHLKTNPQNGVSVFTGMGIGIGHALSASVNNAYLFGFTDGAIDTACNCNSGILVEKNFTSSAAMPFYFNAYIPFGVEFRVIRKWIVSVEGNAGLGWQVYIKTSNALRFQYSGGIGLKYFW